MKACKFSFEDKREALLIKQTSEKKMVMVVEDDELFRKSLSTFIKSLGYDVLAAETAESAMEQLAQRPVNLLLTDLLLPGLTGIELARSVRCSDQIPIILISGHLSEESKEEAKEAVIDALMKKPTDLSQLAKKLNEFLVERNPM